MTKRSIADPKVRQSKRPKVQPKRYIDEVLQKLDSPESIAYYEQFHPRMTLSELDATPDDDDCEYLKQQIADTLDERTNVEDVLDIQRRFIAAHDESVISQDAGNLRRQLQTIIDTPMNEGDPSLNGFIVESSNDESVQNESDQEYEDDSSISSTETDSDAESEDSFEADCLTDTTSIQLDENENTSSVVESDGSSDTARRSSDEGYDMSDPGDDDTMDDEDYEDDDAREFITEDD